LLFDDGRPLREITERDVRAMLDTGMAEYLLLEYKSDLYDTSDRGRREFLLDVCMFANAQGGTLLVGIPEERGLDGQPSGLPETAAELGIESMNPEADLQGYDARIVAGIEDRLPIESHPIPLESGRFIFAFRVPNSLRKPHCVRYQGHVYFPSRRQRHRYYMSIREIMDQMMRTASQLERAEQRLEGELRRQEATMASATLFVATIPMYYEDFLVDITREETLQAVANFDVRNPDRPQYQQPEYTFEGLQRTAGGDRVLLCRNGMISLRAAIPGSAEAGAWRFHLAALDIFLHDFTLRAQALCRTIGVSGPALLQAEILTRVNLMAVWNYDREHAIVAVRNEGFVFPPVQIGDWGRKIEEFIRPVCDHVHQMFGLARSRWFDGDGNWRDPRT
jgi:hypothetical protein